jgi:hypothetical protein
VNIKYEMRTYERAQREEHFIRLGSPYINPDANAVDRQGGLDS